VIVEFDSLFVHCICLLFFPEYTYTVEARDDHGDGNLATTELVLQVTDVNDNAPKFSQRMYAGVLNPGMRTFQTKVQVRVRLHPVSGLEEIKRR
jgi:hypothetical protein